MATSAIATQKVPKQLFVETTNICNANCVFCAYRFDKRRKVIMDEDSFREIVLQYRQMGGSTINFTPYAGEVFTDRDFLKKVTIAKDLGFTELNTYSNVTLIDKFGMDEILQSGLTLIAVSTSPLDAESYRKIYQSGLYDRMLRNLVNLLERFHSIQSRTVKKIIVSFRSDRPLDAIKQMPDFAKLEPYIHGDVKLGCMQEYDSWMGAIKEEDLLPGMTMKPADTIEKRVPCDRLSMLKVMSNGKMRACGCRYDYSKDTDSFQLGDTADTSLLEAYNGERLQELKQSFIDGCPPEECQKCSWYETFRYEGKD